MLRFVRKERPARRSRTGTTHRSRVAALVASGRAVFAINPLATSRYRDRHRSTRAKSDAVDAIVLANILRTDRHPHRPLPDDSDEVRALRVLTRAQQVAVWDRVRMTNRVRSLLKQFFPGAMPPSSGTASIASTARPVAPS